MSKENKEEWEDIILKDLLKDQNLKQEDQLKEWTKHSKTLAKLYIIQYNALIEEGFNEEQSLQIITRQLGDKK